MAAGIDLLDLGLLIARWGEKNAAALTGLGLAVVVARRRALRPVAALVAGAAGAWFVSWALAQWVKSPPLPPNLIVAVGAVLLGVTGLALPSFGLSVSAAALGFVVGRSAASALPDNPELVILASVTALTLLTATLALRLPWLVTSVAGGGATVLGMWGWVGASGTSPELFRTQPLWATLLAVGVVLTAGLDRVRDRSALARAERRARQAEEDARRRREEEERRRYAKYLE